MVILAEYFNIFNYKYEEKLTNETHHTSYLGVDHDRGRDIIWNIIDISNLPENNKENLLFEFEKLKQLQHENINLISGVWKRNSDQLVFITDRFVGGSIRQ